jgi:hypothetical protein
MSFFGDDDDEMVEEQRAERDHGRNLQASAAGCSTATVG